MAADDDRRLRLPEHALGDFFRAVITDNLLHTPWRRVDKRTRRLPPESAVGAAGQGSKVGQVFRAQAT